MTIGTTVTLTICFLIILSGATSIFATWNSARIQVKAQLEIAEIQRETIRKKSNMHMEEFKSRMRILLSTSEIADAAKELSDRGVSPHSEHYEEELVTILSK
jgi:hypothetical protein